MVREVEGGEGGEERGGDLDLSQPSLAVARLPTTHISPPPKLPSLSVLETNTASLRRINRHAR